jgi:hypothetical protein
LPGIAKAPGLQALFQFVKPLPDMRRIAGTVTVLSEGCCVQVRIVQDQSNDIAYIPVSQREQLQNQQILD